MAKGRPKKNPDLVKAFARNLNDIKYKRGISNDTIAALMGFKHTSQVSYWTAGHGMPTPSNLKRLADVLHVKPSELTGQKLMVVTKQEGIV